MRLFLLCLCWWLGTLPADAQSCLDPPTMTLPANCTLRSTFAPASHAYASVVPLTIDPDGPKRTKSDTRCGCRLPCPDAAGPEETVWLQIDGLLWSLNGYRGPALVNGATGTLFANEAINGDYRGGARLCFGSWFEDCRKHGLDVGVFYLTDRDDSAVFGVGPITRPFQNLITGLPDALPVSVPGRTSGTSAIRTDGLLAGAEVNYRRPFLLGDKEQRFDWFVGVRLLRLEEELGITDNMTTFDPTLGVPIGSFFTITDAFKTTNTFLGLNIGLAREHWNGPWRFDWRAAVAVGRMTRESEITGQTLALLNGAGAQLRPEGLLAHAGNRGTTESTRLAVIPELRLNIGYQISQRGFVRVGYSLLVATDVSRPGDRMDTNIAPTSLAGFGPMPPVLPSLPPDRAATLILHGVNVGVEFRF